MEDGLDARYATTESDPEGNSLRDKPMPGPVQVDIECILRPWNHTGETPVPHGFQDAQIGGSWRLVLGPWPVSLTKGTADDMCFTASPSAYAPMDVVPDQGVDGCR